MQIIQYTPNLLQPLTDFYNTQMSEVPHCYPARVEDFEYALRGVTGKVEDNDFEDETAFLALQSGIVKAFVHVGYYEEGDENKVKKGFIRFLDYERGERLAGQATLEKAEDYFRSNGATQSVAFSKMYRYNFYLLEYAELSDKQDHVHGLLGINDYERYHGQVILDWHNYNVSKPTLHLPIDISVEWKDGRGKLPNCHIRTHQDGEEIGECWNVSCGQFSSHPDAQDWVYTDWIGVEDAYQGDGLGKYLLQHSLYEMQKVGYKHASLTTEWNNNRALLFYSNFGYHAVDWTYAYEKVLLDSVT